jgi:putative oxidoreductase
MNACKLAQQYGPLVGRVLLANIFLVSGFKKIGGFAATAGYMTSKGLPMADALLVATIIIELGGGLMLLAGWQARWAASALVLWMIPVTYVFHAYWGLPADQAPMQFIQFQKNLAIMGGLLYVIAFGPGPYSLGKDKC